MVGRLNLDAQLNGPVPPRTPGTMGAPRKWGDRLPSPRQTAADGKPWRLVEATLYGRTATVRFKPFTAWWRSAGPDRPLKCVVVWRPHEQWPHEQWPHETKDSLGAHRGQPRSPKAVARTALFKMLLYSVVTVWYSLHGHGSAHATWKYRPWYRHKRSASFADMVTTFRRATFASALLDETGAGPPRQEVGLRLPRCFDQAAAAGVRRQAQGGGPRADGRPPPITALSSPTDRRPS